MTVKKQERKNEVAPENKVTFIEALNNDMKEYLEADFKVAEGYDVSNAIQSAYYALTQMPNNALQKVSFGSVKNAVRQMATMGLYPDKRQGYFIPYGDKVVFMPSYMGYQMIAERDFGVKTYATIVYKGDTLETAVDEFGNDYVVPGSHKRGFSPFNAEEKKIENVVGAYAVGVYPDGTTKYEIMDINQIKTAWSKAKTTNVQKEFYDQMVKRTVLNRLTKGIISTNATDSARQQQILQAVYDSDGYDYEDENKEKVVDMKEVEVKDVSPFEDEDFIEQEDVIDVEVNVESEGVDPF